MDCKSEVKMLSELAEKYGAKASSDPRKNWVDLLKAHTLYNACAYRTSDKKWMPYIFELQNMYWREDVTSTLDGQISLYRKFQRELSIIRDECHDDLSKVGSLIKNWDCAINNLHSGHNRQVTRSFCDSLQTISLKTNAKMKVLAGKIIQESVELCGGQPPCKFTAVAMGSLAKGEATPYSDLEFMFLVERKDKDIIKYFQLLAMTVYFLIGNIQETKLKYMDIDELKNFDDKCKNGFKIDGLQGKAGNIPTGNGTPEQRNKFILTVSELIDKYRAIYLSPNLQEAAKGDLTSMLAHTSALYGDNGLLDDFKLAKCNIKSNAARRDVHAKMIQADIKDYSFLPLDELEGQNYSVDLKSAIYRFPSLLIYNLKIICNINSGTSWQTLGKLFSEEKLSKTFYYWLRFLLASALYIRLAAYLHYDSQNERISFLQQLGSKSSANLNAYEIWHIPQSLAFHMSVHMIPLKKSIMMKELDEIMKILATDIQYDRQLVAVHYLCYSGKFVEALEILELRRCDSYVEKGMLAICYMTLKKWKKFQPIVHHILECYGRFSQYAQLYWMFMSATGYNQLGVLTTAKVMFDELMNQLDIITEKAGFDDDTQVCMEAYMHAAHFYLRINDAPSAEKYYNKGNVLTETIPQEQQDTIIYSRHMKAGWLYNMRRYTEAERVLKDNIKLCQQLYGSDACHESIASNYRGLGDVYNAIGKLEESFRCRQKAREIMEGCNPLKLEDNNFGPEEDIKCAHYHESREDFKSALSFYNKALTTLKKGYGTESYFVPDLYRQIAVVHIKQGNLQHTEKYLKKALSIYSSIDTQYLTDYVAKCHFDMGRLLYLKGCFTEALDHFGWVTSSEVPTVNLDHRDLLCETFAYTGKIFHTLGDNESAIANYEKALSVLPKMPVTRTKFIIGIYTDLTGCYFQCFNLRAAYIVLKKALRFLTQQEIDYKCCEAECFLIVFALMIVYFKMSGTMSGILNLAEKDTANGILKCVGPHGELFFL